MLVIQLVQFPQHRLLAGRVVGPLDQVGEDLEVPDAAGDVGGGDLLRSPLPGHGRGDVRVVRRDAAQDLLLPGTHLRQPGEPLRDLPEPLRQHLGYLH